MKQSKGSRLHDRYLWYGFILMATFLDIAILSGLSLTEAELFRIIPHIGGWSIGFGGSMLLLAALWVIAWRSYYFGHRKSTPSWMEEFHRWRETAEYSVAFWSFAILFVLLFMAAIAFLFAFWGVYGWSVYPNPRDETNNLVGPFSTTGLEDDRWLATSLILFSLSAVTVVCMTRYIVFNHIVISTIKS